jgi:renalase
MKKIAIIGTGLAGLTLATELKAHADISLFDKARGVGGRLSTRYESPYEFDHGAQYFTVKDSRFQAFIEKLLAAKVIKRWDPIFAEFSDRKMQRISNWDENMPHYVGTPRMNTIAKHLAQSQDVKLNTCITQLTSRDQTWTLESDQGQIYGGYDWVICTAPAPQTATLMPPSFKYLRDLQQIKMQACFCYDVRHENASGSAMASCQGQR